MLSGMVIETVSGVFLVIVGPVMKVVWTDVAEYTVDSRVST